MTLSNVTFTLQAEISTEVEVRELGWRPIYEVFHVAPKPKQYAVVGSSCVVKQCKLVGQHK